MNKKIWVIVGIVVFSVAFIAAAWYFTIQGNLKANVVSIGNYESAILNFEDFNLDTTENSDRANGTIHFAYNRAGNFIIEIVETIADLSNGECLNGEQDCKTTFRLDNGYDIKDIRNGDKIYIPLNTNLKYIYANISCMAYSCPQTRDVNIKLTQIV